MEKNAKIYVAGHRGLVGSAIWKNLLAVMPTNLYGPNDNFDLEKSHVLPAIVRKIHLAKALMAGNWDLIRKDLNNSTH